MGKHWVLLEKVWVPRGVTRQGVVKKGAQLGRVEVGNRMAD